MIGMIKNKIWYLQKTNLFKEMSPEEMKELDRITVEESVKKKSAVFVPGDPSRQIYILKVGHIKISRVSEEGREVTLALLEPGDIFGELEVIQDSPRDTLAETLDDSQLCVIQKEQFLSMVRQKPEFSYRLTKLIGFRLKKIENRVEDLVFRDVHSRVALLLWQFSKDYGKATSKGIQIEIKVTHQDIANLIGSIRETVSSVLGEFKKEGLITFEGRNIIVVRTDLLKNRTGSSTFSSMSQD